MCEGIFKNTVCVVSDTFDNDLSNNHDSVLVKIINSTSNEVMKNITGDFTKNNIVKAKSIKQSIHGLGKNPTGNFMELLGISIIVSMILGSNDIFRKR